MSMDGVLLRIDGRFLARLLGMRSECYIDMAMMTPVDMACESVTLRVRGVEGRQRIEGEELRYSTLDQLQEAPDTSGMSYTEGKEAVRNTNERSQ